jgi:hypothetical protein
VFCGHPPAQPLPAAPVIPYMRVSLADSGAQARAGCAEHSPSDLLKRKPEASDGIEATARRHDCGARPQRDLSERPARPGRQSGPASSFFRRPRRSHPPAPAHAPTPTNTHHAHTTHAAGFPSIPPALRKPTYRGLVTASRRGMSLCDGSHLQKTHNHPRLRRRGHIDPSHVYPIPASLATTAS